MILSGGKTKRQLGFLYSEDGIGKSTKEMVKTFIDTFDKKHNVKLILSVDNKDNPQDKYSTTKERLKGNMDWKMTELL